MPPIDQTILSDFDLALWVRYNNAFFINFKRLSVFNSQTHVITELVKKKIVKYLHKCNELFTISTILFNVSFVDIS